MLKVSKIGWRILPTRCATWYSILEKPFLYATELGLQSYTQQANKLAGQIALLKSYSTACGQDTARDAVQIFGGRGITQTGIGKYIEHVGTLVRLVNYVLTPLTSIIGQLRSMHS